jgi:hypothetical protein
MLFAIYAMLYLQDRMHPRMSIEKLVTILSVIIVRVPSLESKIPPHDSITKYIRARVYRFLSEKSPEKLKEFENDVNNIYNTINGISDDEKK